MFRRCVFEADLRDDEFLPRGLRRMGSVGGGDPDALPTLQAWLAIRVPLIKLTTVAPTPARTLHPALLFSSWTMRPLPLEEKHLRNGKSSQTLPGGSWTFWTSRTTWTLGTRLCCAWTVSASFTMNRRARSLVSDAAPCLPSPTTVSFLSPARLPCVTRLTLTTIKLSSAVTCSPGCQKAPMVLVKCTRTSRRSPVSA